MTRDPWRGAFGPDWAGRWRIPRVEAHGVIPSTSDRARELDGTGAPDWTVVVARAQSAGRGRRGRSWIAGNGEGLLFSLLLPAGWNPFPGAPSLAVGLAVARALEEAADTSEEGLRLELKWPNDLMLDGRKLGGILCERSSGPGSPERPARVVAGVGINLCQREADFPVTFRDRATSLRMAGAPEPEAGEVIGRVVRGLRQLPDEPFPRLLEELNARDFLRGRVVTTEEGVRGMGAGIDPQGALLLEATDGRRHRVVAGGVTPSEPRTFLSGRSGP